MHQSWSNQANNCSSKISHIKFDIFHIILEDHTDDKIKSYVEEIWEQIENFEESMKEWSSNNTAPMFHDESVKWFCTMSWLSNTFEVPFHSVSRDNKVDWIKVKNYKHLSGIEAPKGVQSH